MSLLELMPEDGGAPKPADKDDKAKGAKVEAKADKGKAAKAEPRAPRRPPPRRPPRSKGSRQGRAGLARPLLPLPLAGEGRGEGKPCER